MRKYLFYNYLWLSKNCWIAVAPAGISGDQQPTSDSNSSHSVERCQSAKHYLGTGYGIKRGRSTAHYLCCVCIVSPVKIDIYICEIIALDSQIVTDQRFVVPPQRIEGITVVKLVGSCLEHTKLANCLRNSACASTYFTIIYGYPRIAG